MYPEPKKIAYLSILPVAIFHKIMEFLPIYQNVPMALTAPFYYKTIKAQSIFKLKQQPIPLLTNHPIFEQHEAFLEEKYPEVTVLQELGKDQEQKQTEIKQLRGIIINTAMKKICFALVVLNRSSDFQLSAPQLLQIALCHPKICELMEFNYLIPKIADEKTVLDAIKGLKGLMSQLVLMPVTHECKKKYRDAYILRYKTSPKNCCMRPLTDQFTYHSTTGSTQDIKITKTPQFLKDLNAILDEDSGIWNYKKRPVCIIRLKITQCHQLFASTDHAYEISLQNTAIKNLLKLSSITKILSATTWKTIPRTLQLSSDTIQQLADVSHLSPKELTPKKSTSCPIM